LAFLPGFASILLTFLIKERTTTDKNISPKKTGFFSFLSYWKSSPGEYKKLVLPLIIIALVNSSDVFLLLKIKEGGASDVMVILLYIFYNTCYALAAFPAGKFADKIGMKKVFITGWVLFILVYAGFAALSNLYWLALLLVAYGLFAAMTEGIAKAWISNLVPNTETAAAIGTYTGFQSIAALCASTLAGMLWHFKGSAFSFYFTAIVVSLAVLLLMYQTKNEKFIEQHLK
jgi:MFS family permease